MQEQAFSGAGEGDVVKLIELNDETASDAALIP